MSTDPRAADKASGYSAFGGDREQITVAGQSAGAWSIAFMMANDACHGLFARAILQSAPLGIAPLSVAEAEVTTRELMAIPGLDATETDALRGMPAAKLLSAAATLGMAKKQFGNIATPIAPILDGELVARAPMAAALAGELADLDIIIGTTREEMMAFFRFDPDFATATDRQAEGFYKRCFGPDGDAQLAEARRHRPGGSPAEIVSDAESDLKMVRPSLAFAEAVGRNDNSAYVYQFDWQSPMPGLDACHCLELPFVLGNPDAWTNSPMLAGSDPVAVAGLSATIQAAWAAFAKTGNPNSPNIPDWPTYNHTSRSTMCFGDVVNPIADPAGLTRRIPMSPQGIAGPAGVHGR